MHLVPLPVHILRVDLPVLVQVPHRLCKLSPHNREALASASGGGVELDEGVTGDGGVGDNGVEGVSSGDLDTGGEGAVVRCWFGFEDRVGFMDLVVWEEEK